MHVCIYVHMQVHWLDIQKIAPINCVELKGFFQAEFIQV